MGSISRRASAEKGIFRNVIALGLVSLFTDVSSEMVFSLLPMFILDLPGSSTAALGLIEGLAENLSYTLRALSGLVSDRFRKRKIIVAIGYALSNIAKPFFAAAQSVLDALVIRVSDRVGKAIRTAPRDALLSDSVPDERRGVAFGVHRALDQSGAIIGPLLASIILFLGLSARMIFLLSFIPGLIALMILVFIVQERFGRISETERFGVMRNLKEVFRGRFLLLLFIVGVFSLGAFNFSFIMLNARECGVADELIPIVYLVINLAHTLIAIPSGILSDKIGRESVLAMGYGTFLATCLLIYWLPKNQLHAFTVAVFFGLYMGILETVQRALIPKYAEKSYLMGTAYGIYYLVVGSAFLAANSIVGLLWQIGGSAIAAKYSAAL
ncbi:MAG: MFS transporter, partial [Candidatus Bathyarchaeota archaeon]|nr:MFS transporter [Candidatus Bathyarchaeota archaeon]